MKADFNDLYKIELDYYNYFLDEVVKRNLGGYKYSESTSERSKLYDEIFAEFDEDLVRLGWTHEEYEVAKTLRVEVEND